MKTNIIANITNMKNVVNRTFMVMKTMHTYLALVLMVLGLGISSQVFATNMVLEATAFYGKDYTPSGAENTNNTWSPCTSGGTYGSCSTTANGVTISGSKMTVNSNHFKVQNGQAFTIQAASGTYLYRMVIKGTSGAGASLTESNGILESNSDTWTCAQSYWGFTNGKTSVTFTNNSGVDYQINSINVYTYRAATSAEASISVSSFTVNEGSEASKTTTLTSNLGPFDGANTPYYNDIDKDIDDNITSSTLQFDHSMYSTTYTNGSTISFDINPYAAGTYTAAFMLGKQTSSNTAVNYHMIAIWIPFTVIVNESCNQPTVAFTDAGPIAKNVTASNFTNGATVKYNSVGTGQTITYSSDNTTVATVNSTTGEVDVKAIGTAHITASVSKNSTYCAAEASYTLNVTGYSVTFHYPACAESSPANLTNQYGSIDLETEMAVSGYAFAGWTDHEVADAAIVTPLYTSSVTVSDNIDLYAVYSAVSNEFTLSTANPIVAGDYVITGSYNATNAPVMTNSLSNGKMSANTEDYTVTSAGKLTCKEEECIWTLAAVSGGWTIRNVSNGKYLSSASGAHSNSDLKLRLVDDPDDYSVWTITQGSSNRYNVVNNKRNTDGEDRKNFYCNGTYFGFYTTISPFFFKRTASASTYTSSPSCDMDEFTVTMQSNAGGSASAAGTGGVCVWDSPVLSKLYGTETVTITATPGTGYTFSSWTVVSGGATLASTTTNPTTFTMPTSNVVIRPNFTPQSYAIEYRDKNGADAASFSGTHQVGYPMTHTYGTATTLDEPTKTDYVFMGWFAETDCSGSRINTIGATDYSSGPIVLYALWMQYSDPLAWCPEPEVHLTGDNVYVTSTKDKSVKAVNTLTLNAINLVPGSTVRLSTPASSGIMFSSTGVKYNATTATIDFTADAGGDITDETVYVHYYPTSAGSGAPADVTVTATYQTNTDYYSTRDVHVRNMPSAFAIAVKQGNSWFALPANMSGDATNPAGVPLNVDESSWTAKGPSTLAYELWPVLSTTGSSDRYADYGEKVRFSGNSNKGLWASTSGNTLNDNAAIAGIGTGSATTNYEWNITTTAVGSTWKYTLKMEGQSNFLNYYNSSVWGSYGSGISDIYLIPLTAVETAGMAVMEWGESEVAVKCAANTTLTKVTIDGTEVSPKPSLTSLGGDIYKITGGGMPNLSTLATYAMKPMVIEVEESSTAKQFVLTIPFILTSTNSPAATPKTAVDLRNYAAGGSQDAKNKVIGVVDVVVRNGAQLDVTNAESTACSFSDLYIYPGGKVHIITKDLGAKNVYLRGGFSWLEAEKDYRLPQMLVESGMKITGIGSAGNGVYYDLHLDKRRYYMMAVPKDVALENITNEEGGDEFTAWLKEYDGSQRTLTPKGKGWVTIKTSSLLRGVGYEMSIKPRVTGRTIGVLRMPLLKSTAWSDETACTPSVTAWGFNDDNVTANNKGWNFIGNPFFSAFRSTDDKGQLGSNMEIRDMVHHEDANGNWTGTWDWTTTSDVKYITIPQKMYDDYTDVRVKNYELEAFYPFFIQAKTTGNLSFTSGSKILKAPSLFRAAVAEREVDIDFMLTDANGTSDQAGLTVGNEYSEDFDMDDKEKTIVNENYLKVYTIVGDYRTAFNALPEAAAALPIPVGYIAPNAGYYTFSLVDGSYAEVEHVWLTDYETSSTVDLLEGAYEFETAKGTNNARLVLNIILKPETHETPTGWEEIDETDDGPTKFIYQDKMFIKQNGVIYDATGKRVREINK